MENVLASPTPLAGDSRGLGGATATHVRIGTPFWFPVAMGALLWIAYSLRSPRLRAFLFTPAR